MNHAQVIQDLPVERRQIVCSLKAGDACHELLLAEEAHSDVVPQLRRFRQLTVCCSSIFCLQVKIERKLFGLILGKYRNSRIDNLRVFRII